MSFPKREPSSVVDWLRDFHNTFDKSSECLQNPLPLPKNEMGSTKSKDFIFAHYYNDINEHPNRQIRLLFRFGNNNSCVFSIKKFEVHGNQFNLTEIVNLNRRESHHFYWNWYYVANKCEIKESIYDL